MPWSNQSGGGWNGGNNNSGGPWGQGQPPRGGGSPPDLEDIIKKGQDQLKRAIPGGGGGFSPMMLGIVILALAGLYLVKAVYTVQPDELAVELRFGKPKDEIASPGIHFHLWPIETYEVANVRENQIDIGDGTGTNSRGLMLSGDQNIVDVEFTVLFQVINPGQYLFNVKDPEQMVEQVAESAMREIVGRRPAQDIFRDARGVIADEVRQITQGTLDQYGAGLQVNAINIKDVAPPREVANAFDEVQRAEQDEDRFVEEANRYSNRVLGAARGEAAQIREDAAAYKNRVVEEAKGEAQRFISVYDEYIKAPDVTRKRLFLETMENVLRDSEKVIMEQGQGQGVVPYLPLPEINKRRADVNENTAGASQ